MIWRDRFLISIFPKELLIIRNHGPQQGTVSWNMRNLLMVPRQQHPNFLEDNEASGQKTQRKLSEHDAA